MAKKSSPALIGVFVVGAVLLTIAAVVIWGSRTLFERKYEYVCYFSGSVNGLSKGAPVKYRGVEIGAVTEVRVRYHQAPKATQIPVLIEVWGKRLRELGGNRDPTPELLAELVARGLRARLSTLSLVTGVLYVSLDEVPGSPVSFVKLPGSGGAVEIPTLPTELEEAQQSVLAVLASLKAADFKAMSDAVSRAALSMNELASGPHLQATLRELPLLMSALQDLTTSFKTDAGKTMASLRKTLDSASGAISPHAPLPADLTQTLSDVDKAAVAIRELADFLRRNPHAIVAGTKPRGAAR